ncbi:MAG TPA: trypsin-like peptidase domain-containing protein [Gemmatimonadaceae bacterium]|nr:trypsin-like peptidase domain-containing protein [Gemmatimonadaceae bacterium]
MTINISRSRLLAVAAVAFVGGVIFASSMDWTDMLVAQPRASAPVVNIAHGGTDVQGGFVAIADAVTPAVVSIQAERDARPAANNRRNGQPQSREDLLRQFFGQPDDSGPEASSGTGFIVSKDGYVLTNNHVVDGMDRITVSLTDRREFKARVIGHDPQTDVAVIKIDANNLPAVTLGDDGATRVGEWVLAIGNPYGLDFTVTAGIVSAKGRSNELAGLNPNNYRIQDFIQTDAAINPGNSGGPLVNSRGEVIGINSAIASRTGSYTGYGFAIPITLAKTVMDDIIAHGRVRRAIMGASMAEATAEDAAINGMKEIAGAKIGDFCVQVPNTNECLESPAEKAGIERGDLIVSADGKKIDRVSTLQRLLRAHQPGDVVAFDLLRYGAKKSVKVKLTEAPSDEPRTVASNSKAAPDDAAPAGSTALPTLGITVEPLTASVATEAKLPASLKGVAVSDVVPGSVSEGKFFPGDVITEVRVPANDYAKTPVTSIAGLRAELSKVKAGQVVSFVVTYVTNPRSSATATRVVNLRVGE